MYSSTQQVDDYLASNPEILRERYHRELQMLSDEDLEDTCRSEWLTSLEQNGYKDESEYEAMWTRLKSCTNEL